MKVNSLNNNYLLNQPIKNSDKTEKVSKERLEERDTIQISAKAQQLNEAKVTGKDLDMIKTRIEEKFYNSEEIINSVADAILKEVKNS